LGGATSDYHAKLFKSIKTHLTGKKKKKKKKKNKKKVQSMEGKS